MSACKRCQVAYPNGRPDSFGSDPKCAFPNGEFVSKNWQCATMNRLRDIAEGSRVHVDDASAAIIPIADGGGFVVLCWYKNRGCTSSACWINDDEPPKNLTIELAEAAIRSEHQTFPLEPGTGQLAQLKADRDRLAAIIEENGTHLRIGKRRLYYAKANGEFKWQTEASQLGFTPGKYYDTFLEALAALESETEEK